MSTITGMRVLLTHIVDQYAQYGGVEKILLLLARELRKRGTIELAAAINESRISEELSAAGIPVFPLPPRGLRHGVHAFRNMLHIQKSYSPSLVHSHHRFTTFLFQCAPARRFRLAHTFHVEQFTRRWLPFFGDAATAVSQGCKDHFVRYFWLPEEFITVIHNGVALPSAAGRAMVVARPSGKRVISVVARLTEQKGHAVFLKALAALPAEVRERVTVYIVGDGEKRKELEEQSRRLKLDRTIIFAGHQEDVFPYLAASDFTVLPSLWEGFGLSAVESMLCGKPVIGSRVGGIPELMLEGVTGLLVPPNNARALKEAIAKLLAEPETVERLGKAGRTYAESKFTVPVMIEGYIRFYSKVLLKRHAH